MMNQMISAAAAAARETFRATDGKFGTQPLAEADLDFDATSGAEQPADGEIVFQQRDGKIFSGEEVLKHAQDAARKYYEMYSVHSKTGTQLADKDDLASESVAAVAKMIRSWEAGKGSGVATWSRRCAPARPTTPCAPPRSCGAPSTGPPTSSTTSSCA